ncbi:MAG: NADH-quinone oxidoreductase subunit H [Endomicrobiales bacterium]|nr:NADH-quinone oxidoreductase subunit H [Endomicrobiales bacterium]
MEKIELLSYFFDYLVFPGLLFVVASGMLVSWIDRKITARLQWRVGPGLLQPYYDIRKLFLKEVIIPEGGNKWSFIIAPMCALISIVIISNIVLKYYIDPSGSFVGDIIVVIYMFAAIPVASIIGASASKNPYASLGASREMKSMLAYELPFLMCIMVPVIKTGSISMGAIIQHQLQNGPIFMSLSGLTAFITSIFCIQAKMGIVPFDYSEAETEICGGVLVEYSGALLAIWKLVKMSLLVVAPLFIIVLFASTGFRAGIFAVYFVLLLIVIILKNTNPRLRIDQALRGFWTYAAVASLTALVLAVTGY